jgi:hypothetical protein
MKGLGFKAFNGDRCAFIRGLPPDHIYIAVHVDDFLIVGALRNIKPFLIELQSEYVLSITPGPHYSYVGLNIYRRENGDITVDQSGYRMSIISMFAPEIASFTRNPAAPSSMTILNEAPKDDVVTDARRYLSAVMKVLWLARFTAYHLLWTTVYLATHSQRPTLSPAESEQYSTAEAVTYGVWVTDFLNEMGHPPKQPIVLYHENSAAVWMSTNVGQFTRTKHFLAKINFVMQNVTRKIVQLRLLRGIEHPADMGTKPQTSKAIKQHSRITGYTSGEYIE